MFNTRETITEEFISFYGQFKKKTMEFVYALRDRFKEPEPLPPPTFLERCHAYLAEYDWWSISVLFVFFTTLFVVLFSSRNNLHYITDFWVSCCLALCSLAKPILMRTSVPHWAQRYYDNIKNNSNCSNAGKFIVSMFLPRKLSTIEVQQSKPPIFKPEKGVSKKYGRSKRPSSFASSLPEVANSYDKKSINDVGVQLYHYNQEERERECSPITTSQKHQYKYDEHHNDEDKFVDNEDAPEIYSKDRVFEQMSDKSATYNDKLNYIADSFTKGYDPSDNELDFTSDLDKHSVHEDNQQMTVNETSEMQDKVISNPNGEIHNDVVCNTQSKCIVSQMQDEYIVDVSPKNSDNLALDKNREKEGDRLNYSDFEYDQVNLTKSGNRVDNLTPRSVSVGKRTNSSSCSKEDVKEEMTEIENVSSDIKSEDNGDYEIIEYEINGKQDGEVDNQMNYESVEEMMPHSNCIPQKYTIIETDIL